jgi:hypothetical protein
MTSQRSMLKLECGGASILRWTLWLYRRHGLESMWCHGRVKFECLDTRVPAASSLLLRMSIHDRRDQHQATKSLCSDYTRIYESMNHTISGTILYEATTKTTVRCSNVR